MGRTAPALRQCPQRSARLLRTVNGGRMFPTSEAASESVRSLSARNVYSKGTHRSPRLAGLTAAVASAVGQCPILVGEQ